MWCVGLWVRDFVLFFGDFGMVETYFGNLLKKKLLRCSTAYCCDLVVGLVNFLLICLSLCRIEIKLCEKRLVFLNI